MEYIEILFCDINSDIVDKIIKNDFHIKSEVVKSSHFYDAVKKEDIEYSEEFNLSEYFSTQNTGTILLNNIKIGVELHDVMTVISFNQFSGDIILNFSENEFVSNDFNYIKLKIKKMIEKLTQIREKYGIKNIKLGYESVFEEENVVLNISDNETTMVNKFEGEFSEAVESAYREN